MERFLLKALEKWKTSSVRKPLIMRGARQVGKTWLLKEFGKRCFEKCVYVNFEDTPSLQSMFDTDFDIKRIITVLEIHSKTRITQGNTLIILDEIQAAGRVITSLKYFQEKAPEYHVVAAGSLLGISMPDKTSFPVGKVDFLDLHSLSFSEFLCALGQEQLVEVLKNKDWITIGIFKEKLLDFLKTYYYIGGMPEVVFLFTQNNDLNETKHIQKRILNSYEADFSKHAPNEIVPRIRMVWQSIPMQLARENKKFIYGSLREGARAKDFELAIQWLLDAGLLIKLNRVSKPELPLAAFQDFSTFKLYMHDIGLLSAISGLDAQSLISGNNLFLQFKGALTEQFVMQQLYQIQTDYLGYWTNERSTYEVDFIIQAHGEIIPLEVKAEENLKSKSFSFFREKYKPKTAIRASLANYKEELGMTNIPLYSIEYITDSKQGQNF